MFTGLVAGPRHVVAAVDATATACGWSIRTASRREIAEGDSVAVNGVCLTATRSTASAALRAPT